MSLDVSRNTVAVVSLVGVVFLSHVVGKLRLVEIGFTVLTIPQNHVTQSVLNKETVSTNGIAVDLKTSSNVVVRRFYLTLDIVVCAPQPNVIDYHVT